MYRHLLLACAWLLPAIGMGGNATLAMAQTAPPAQNPPQLHLRLIETTDLHGQGMDFDYFTDRTVESYGLVRTASLIHAARREVANALLVDNGDLLQGSASADYWAEKGLKPGEVHSMYKVMNPLDYTVGNIGNHEFNYGLDFLHEAINDAAFPYISANVLDANTGKHLFKPYLIKTIQARDNAGNTHPLTVGFIGFVPPQILTWDKLHLTGKVTVMDIKASAEQLVPHMQREGAEVIVAIPHSGLSSKPYVAMAENSVYYLSQVKGIDAILFGHTHGIFPGPEYATIAVVDIHQGTINGVPAVMPGFWGDHLGVVDLTLEKHNGRWQRVNGLGQVRALYDRSNKRALVAGDNTLRQKLNDDHRAVREYVSSKVGKSTAPIRNYLVHLQNDASLQLVNDAQTAYVKRYIQGDPDLAELPVLSAAAPFKAGGRHNAPEAYLNLPAGDLSLRNLVDLYPFPNTLVALKLSGAQLKEWLECAAGMFNHINPQSTAPQPLLNWMGFGGYNFDVISGIDYRIDITQPARYNGDCELQSTNNQRITQLRYQGKPVSATQAFLLATNNYRAFGGKFAGTYGDNIAFIAPDDNRAVLIQYLREQTRLQGALTPQAQHHWQLQTIASTSPLDIRLETASGKSAQAFIEAQAHYPLTYLGENALGYAEYRVDLQTPINITTPED